MYASFNEPENLAAALRPELRISRVNKNLVIFGRLSFCSPGLQQHNYVQLLLFEKGKQHLRHRTMKLQLRFRLAKAVFCSLL